MAEESSKYFRTEIRIVILSEDRAPNEEWEINEIVHEFQQGDFSGEWEIVSSEEISPKQAAEALIAQGSDPEFFGLEDDGTLLPRDDEYAV